MWYLLAFPQQRPLVFISFKDISNHFEPGYHHDWIMRGWYYLNPDCFFYILIDFQCSLGLYASGMAIHNQPSESGFSCANNV